MDNSILVFQRAAGRGHRIIRVNAKISALCLRSHKRMCESTLNDLWRSLLWGNPWCLHLWAEEGALAQVSLGRFFLNSECSSSHFLRFLFYFLLSHVIFYQPFYKSHSSELLNAMFTTWGNILYNIEKEEMQAVVRSMGSVVSFQSHMSPKWTGRVLPGMLS